MTLAREGPDNCEDQGCADRGNEQNDQQTSGRQNADTYRRQNERSRNSCNDADDEVQKHAPTRDSARDVTGSEADEDEQYQGHSTDYI